VGAPDSVGTLRTEADEVVCPWVPAGFAAVSQFYDDFPQTTDDEVTALLARARHPA
jgi:predicted phosphoribosyltransferase